MTKANFETLKSAIVSIGGNLADHKVLCTYTIENGVPIIEETWLVHNSRTRKIRLRPFLEQVAMDGLYGYLE